MNAGDLQGSLPEGVDLARGANLRHAAQRQAFLLELADVTASLDDPALIKQEAARLLGSRLRANRVAYFEVRGLHFEVESDYCVGVPSIRGRYPVDSFGPRLFEACRRGQVLSCSDVETDPRLSPADRMAMAGIQTRAYIGAPLIKHVEFVAGLAVHSAAPRAWTPEELDLVQEVAERTWAAIERGRAEQALRRQTLRLEKLEQIAKALASNLDTERIVQIVTDSATMLTGAQIGAFIYNVTDERGPPGFSFTVCGAPREVFEKFGVPRGTALFGHTYRGEGVIRADDIRADPRYGKSPPDFGLPKGHPPVVSYLAVPVISRTGKVHGGLFFGHAQPSVFTADAENIVTGIATHAALAMDNAMLLETTRREVEQRQRAESMEAAQRRVLELSVADAPLATVLEELVRTVEAQSSEGLRASVLLLDPDGVHLRHGAAPSLPQPFNAAIDGIAIGPAVGSCGTAAFLKRPVLVSDIAHDPLWAGFRELAAAHGLKACWSLPILSSRGKVLGTFAMYYGAAKGPDAWDMRLVEAGTRTAALVIEREHAETHRELLIHELNHRVKNTLATVQSVVTLTLRNAEPEVARESLDARLIAMAQAHDVLTRANWESADLRDVITNGVRAYAAEGRFTQEGPDLRLRPRAALAISMTVHELVTNAVKYGALSNDRGRIAIRWRSGQEGSGNAPRATRFQLSWIERGGPPVRVPARRGFGSRLIEKGLASDVRGKVRLSFVETGVSFDLEAPLTEIEASEQALGC